MASVGGATFHNGRMSFRRTEIGERAFVGNAALRPVRQPQLGTDSLVGVHTVPPPGRRARRHVLARLPGDAPAAAARSQRHLRREPDLPARRRRRVAERLAIEFFRVTPARVADRGRGLSCTCWRSRSSRAAGTVLLPRRCSHRAWRPCRRGRPGAFVGRAGQVHWWSAPTGRGSSRCGAGSSGASEFVTGLYEAAAVPALLYLLVGTPFLPPAAAPVRGAHRPPGLDRHDVPHRVRPGRDRRRRHDRPRRVAADPPVRGPGDEDVDRPDRRGRHGGDRGRSCSTTPPSGPTPPSEPLSLVMKGEHLPAGPAGAASPPRACATLAVPA